VIQFSISSSDRKIVEELSDNIESIKFFDPVRISEVLGPDCSPFLPQAVRLRLTSAPHIDLARIGSGELRRNVYVNSSLGFLYHFPDGWYASDEAEASQRAVTQNPRVLRTQSLQQASALAEPCTRILASARKNQPSSEEFSPRITILVADPTCFVPDLPFPISVQERSAVEAFGRSLIRAFSGTQLMGPGVSTMRALEIAGHLFLEIPTAKLVPVSGSALRRKIHTFFVLTNIRQYWVIWLFESDTQSELENLMKTSLSFAQPQTALGAGNH